MSVELQQLGNRLKGRNPKLTNEEQDLFFQKCQELKTLKMAVTTRWAQNTIKQITLQNGYEWIPCKSSIANIFKSKDWPRRKSQKRSLKGDPEDKFQKIEKI